MTFLQVYFVVLGVGLGYVAGYHVAGRVYRPLIDRAAVQRDEAQEVAALALNVLERAVGQSLEELLDDE